MWGVCVWGGGGGGGGGGGVALSNFHASMLSTKLQNNTQWIFKK